MATTLSFIGLVNSNTISTSYTSNAGENIVSAGPITISNGITVTIATGSTWTVV